MSRSGNRRLEEGGELGMRGKSRQAERAGMCKHVFELRVRNILEQKFGAEHSSGY